MIELCNDCDVDGYGQHAPRCPTFLEACLVKRGFRTGQVLLLIIAQAIAIVILAVKLTASRHELFKAELHQDACETCAEKEGAAL